MAAYNSRTVPGKLCCNKPAWYGPVAFAGVRWYFAHVLFKRKEDHVHNFYFRYYRTRGPVDALQMRLQG